MKKSILDVCIDDICECSICRSTFHSPKSLPCLHTFCLRCIAQYSCGRTSIECPVCRKQVDLPASGCDELSSNFAIEKLCAAKKKEKKPLRDIAAKQPAIGGACVERYESLCEACDRSPRNPHPAGKAGVSMHKDSGADAFESVAMETVNSVAVETTCNCGAAARLGGSKDVGGSVEAFAIPATGSSESQFSRVALELCPVHSKELEAYCETCGEAACVLCIIAKHGKHDFVEFATAVSRLKESLTRQKTRLADRQKLYHDLSGNVASSITKLHANYANLEAEILRRSFELKKLIDGQAICLLRTVRGEIDAKLIDAVQSENEVNFELARCDSLICRINEKTGSADTPANLTAMEELKDQVDDVLRGEVMDADKLEPFRFVENKNLSSPCTEDKRANMLGTVVDAGGKELEGSFFESPPDQRGTVAVSNRQNVLTQMKAFSIFGIVPAGVAIMGEKAYVVASSNCNSILVYKIDSRGAGDKNPQPPPLAKVRLGMHVQPVGIVAIGDALFIADAYTKGVHRIQLAGDTVSHTKSIKKLVLQNALLSVADRSGNLLVADLAGDQVIELTPALEIVKRITVPCDLKADVIHISRVVETGVVVYVTDDALREVSLSGAIARQWRDARFGSCDALAASKRRASYFVNFGADVFCADSAGISARLYTAKSKIIGLVYDEDARTLIAYGKNFIEFIRAN